MYTHAMMTLDEMLRELKGRLGVTSVEVAKAIGIGSSALAKFRHGRIDLPEERRAQIEAYFWERIKDAPPLPTVRGTSRNADIARRALAGEDYASIARGYGLTRQRVQAIVAAKGVVDARRAARGTTGAAAVAAKD